MMPMFERDVRFTEARVRDLHRIGREERRARGFETPESRADTLGHGERLHHGSLGPAMVAAIHAFALRLAA